MNNVSLTGRLTREPVITYGGQDNNIPIARFTLAVNDHNSTDFINCKAIGKIAEWAERWISRGTKVELTGKIKSGSYTSAQTNSTVYYTEVLASSMRFGESKTESEQWQQRETQEQGGYKSGNEQKTEGKQYDNDFMHVPDGQEQLPFN